MPSGGAAPSGRMNVYVSYARADSGFAEQLCAFLQDAGYEPLTGQSALLRQADAVIFVLSDALARSAACVGEVQEANRLGARVVPVLPGPLSGGGPRDLSERSYIRFYTDPAVPHSGFFDGQKQLISLLEAHWTPAVEREAVHAGEAELRTLTKELQKARGAMERIKRDEDRARRRAMERPPPEAFSMYYDRPPRRERRVRIPWLRGGFLLLVGAWVVGMLASSDVRDATRALAARGASWAEAVQDVTEPPAPRPVAAEDFTPERPAFAGASGANVRGYPLPSATILTELPARAPLNITGRLNVQGVWWFRVVLEDERIGFVHQSVVAWGEPPPAPVQVADVTPVDPAVAAIAGRAGAKIRTGPSRSQRVIVRVERGAALSVIGKRRMGEHWWYHVRLEDGREGFARDDVVTAPDGGVLRV